MVALLKCSMTQEPPFRSELHASDGLKRAGFACRAGDCTRQRLARIGED